MALGNGNPKEGDKGSNFFWELKVLQGLEAIAVAIEAGGGGGGGGGITALTGDVTAGPGSGSQVATIGALKVTGPKIANNAVTYAKMQLVNNFRFLGYANYSPGAPGTANVTELPIANIPYFPTGITGTANGTTFLRGDGQWATTTGTVYDSAEGISKNTALANPTFELGRTALAGTSDLSVARFINSGTQQITLSGTREVAPAAGTALQNAAILRVLNTNTTTQSTVGIYAETVATYNDITNVPGSAAIMGVAGGTGEDVVGVYGLNTSTNLNSVAIRGQATTGIAGRFVSSGNAASLIATSSSTVSLNGVSAIRAENTGSGDANKIIDVVNVTRAPSGIVTAGGGAAITYELNAQGGSGIERPDVVRLAAYSVDLSVAPGSHKTGFRIEVMHNSAAPTERINFYGANIIKLTQGLSEYADDAAAAAGGIPITGLYRTGSFIKIRVS